MEITINDKKFELYNYDDKQSILERYANSLPNTLPIFLHIDSIDDIEVKGGEDSNVIIIKNGSKLVITSVIDILNNTVNSDTNFTNFVRSLSTPSSLLRKNYDNFDYKPATYFFLLYLLSKTNFSYLKGPNKVELKTILDVSKLKLIYFYVNKKFVITNVKGEPIPDKHGNISLSVIEDYYSEFLNKINDMRRLLNTKVINTIRHFIKLDTIKPIPNNVSDFVTQSHTVNLLLKTNELNIEELFDNMDCSEEIPLIYLKKNNKLKIKVSTNFTIPPIWLEELYLLENNKRIPSNQNYSFDIPNDTLLKLVDINYYLEGDDENIIYFKYSIFSKSKKEKLKDDPYIAELYSTNKIVLSEQILDINFTYQIPKGASRFENDGFLNIFKNLITKTTLNIIYIKDISIKGYFDIYDFIYNKTLLADFIDINSLSKFFMFINEFNKPIGDNPLEKQRFNIYFAPGHSYEINSDVVSFALLNKDNDSGEDYIKVNFSHAKSTSQITSVKNILLKLLNLYLSEQSSLGKIYKSIIPSFIYEKQYTIVGREKTYSRRLDKLKREVPSLFRDITVYINQGNRQPIILTDEEYSILKKKYKSENDSHKFLLFKKRWYTSLPLNPENPLEKGGESTGKIFPYIGLKCNPLKIKVPKGKKGKIDVDNSKYAEEEPLIPACYESDQLKHGRNLSVLQKYLEGIDPEDICKKEKKSKEFYILDSTKVLKINKMGEVPTAWNKIFDVFGVKKIESNKKQIYPVVRYGVGDFKDSIIRCLELAFNPLYQKKMLSKSVMSIEENNKIIMDTRNKIANSNLIVGLQSAAPLTILDLKKNLLDSNSYIDAASYIDIFETYYQCNIFIYEYDQTGTVKIIIPNHLGGAYLTKKINKSLPIIIILRTKVVCDAGSGKNICIKDEEESEESEEENDENIEDEGVSEGSHDEISEDKVEEVFDSIVSETNIYQCEILMKYSKPFNFKFNYFGEGEFDKRDSEKTPLGVLDKRDIVGKIALDLFEKYKVYNF